MKRPRLATVGMLAVCVGVCAQAGSRSAGADPVGSNRVRVVVDSAGRQRQVVPTAAECAPFEAKAIWGPGSPTAAPLGYFCYHNPNK